MSSLSEMFRIVQLQSKYIGTALLLHYA